MNKKNEATTNYSHTRTDSKMIWHYVIVNATLLSCIAVLIGIVAYGGLKLIML